MKEKIRNNRIFRESLAIKFYFSLIIFLSLSLISVRSVKAATLFHDNFIDINGTKLSDHNASWLPYIGDLNQSLLDQYKINSNMAGNGDGIVYDGNTLNIHLPIHFRFTQIFQIDPRVSTDPNQAFTEIRLLDFANNQKNMFRFYVSNPQVGNTMDTSSFSFSTATTAGIYNFVGNNKVTIEYDQGHYETQINDVVVSRFNDFSFSPDRITLSQRSGYFFSTQTKDVLLEDLGNSSPSPTPTPVPTPTPTPSPTPSPLATPVPTYSQRDPLWKNNVYDNAQSWAPGNISFERWGCAVTTAATVLGYYNINTLPNGTPLNPGNLNTWLKSQSDGFLRNGLVNWQAISRISKIESTLHPLLPSLEYSWKGSDKSELVSKLQVGHPVILEEPGHFITAYQYNSGTNTVRIRDPFYLATKTTLAAYGDTFVSQRQFQPSHTDLSYILITSDPTVTATLYEGTIPVPDQTRYIQIPLIDQLGGPSQATPFAITELGKPHPVPYTLKLSRTTPGVGTFEILRYDIAGNPVKDEETTLFGSGPLVVNIGTGSTRTTIQKQITFDTLLDEIEVGRRMGAFRRPYKAFELKALVQAAQHIYPRNKQMAKKLLQEVRHELEEDDDHGRHRPALPYRQFFDLLDEDLKDAIKQLF